MAKKRKARSAPSIHYDSSSNVFESLIFTRAQNYGNTYRLRFINEVVKIAQETIRENFDHVINSEKVRSGELPLITMSFPLRNLLESDTDKNYAAAKKAILDFADWKLIFEDEQNFIVTNVLSLAHMQKRESMLCVELRRDVWDMLLDFTKGYTEYNTDVLLKLKNPFARHMYKGLKNQKVPISYSMDKLKSSFGYKGMYDGRDSDFIQRVVAKAKQELDRVADYSFNYEIFYSHHEGRKGRKGIERIEFVSVPLLKNQSEDQAVKMVHPSQILGTGVYKILTEKMYFNYGEVKANIKLFRLAIDSLGEEPFVSWLYDIAPKAFRARTSTQGYVINSLKRYLHKKCGVDFGKEPIVIEERETAPDSDGAVDDPSGNDVSHFREQVSSILLSSPGGSQRPSALDANLHSTGDLFGTLFN